MRNVKNLDIEKSIQNKKLVFEENWFDKLDTITNYLIFFAFIFFSILCLKEIKSSPNNFLEYFILIFVIIFSLYVLFCKLSEKYLKRIKFSIHKEDAKQRILDYAKKNNYRISKIANNLIFLNQPTDSSNLGFGNYEKTTFIFIEDNYLLLEVTAFAKVGEGQHIFPSQEFVDKPPKGQKSKYLYQIKTNQGMCAGIHSEKIGNAIRTIDDWYTVENSDSIKAPIAVEPYGSVPNRGQAYRISKTDFYTLLIN